MNPGMRRKQPLLLIVDDERTQREGLRATLEDRYDVYLAENADAALSLLRTEPVDVLLTDLKMPGEDGMELISRAKSLSRPPSCILMTAYGSEEVAVEAMKLGADDYISKGGMILDDLEKKISRIVRIRALEQENADLKRERQEQSALESIVGGSAAMRKVLEDVRRVASSTVSILITGESGTGKELIARAIHQLSPRSSRALVPVHCAGLTPTLLESELFGHEKGAFTGAVERRIGRFEQAAGGTLFLDEIGEIDGSTQIKLLRALGERTFERVGSNRTIKADVRLVSATNKDLGRLIAEGSFREDLYYRLRVVEIELPALRRRREDIPALAMHFLRDLARENGKKAAEFAPEALRRLADHDWPGNVRELRAAVEHAVVFSTSAEIQARDLPSTLQAGASLAAGLEEAEGSALSFDRSERQLIAKALEETGGNKTQAADLLGISRRTLYRKLIRYSKGG